MYSPPYSEAQKAEVVGRLLAGEPALHLSKEYGINYGTVRRWRDEVKQKTELTKIVRKHTRTPEHLVEHKSSRVLVIPDMHHPFVHPDALAFLKAVRDTYHCNQFICLGDEIDAHAFSRYPMDPDGMTAGKELQAAIESITPFYLEFPHMKVCESNHTIRPWKRAFEAGLPTSFLPSVAKILNAPDGWVWDKRHAIDGVLYIHGDNGRSGQYAHIHYMKQAKRPVVIGHIHAFAGVAYEGYHFAMNTGCLIDVEAYAFKYAKGSLLPVSLGCGVVVGGLWAHFIPMVTDDNGRWTGKL